PQGRVPNAGSGEQIVRLDGDRLRRLGVQDRRLHDWLPTAIDAPGADPVRLRQYGFDVLVDDRSSDPERIKTALGKDFLLMPRLSGLTSGADSRELIDQIDSYPYKDSVAFWMVGEGLGRRRERKGREEEVARTRKLLSDMRGLSAGTPRLTTGILDGDLHLYTRAP